ncbi:MAG: EAL domain-containing protein, partial [Thiomicrospira sp.]|nr:EAL domain-containing protein [Thiomicrospira sp.]
SQTLAMLQQFKQQDMAHLRIAINVSAREFWRTEFVEDLQAQLSQFPEVDPSCLELELTERLAMGDPEKIVSVLEALRALGVRLSIDDFGTGYSSLSYLRRYPIQVLKIDKSFVQDIGKNSDDDAVCLSIVSLAQALNMETIAEGVETPQQEAFLKSIHCTHAQGFYYAMPLYADELSAWLSENYPKLNLPKANLTHI